MFIEYQNKKNQIIPLLLLIVIVFYGVLARWTVVNHTIVYHPIRADASAYFLYAKNLSLFSIYSHDKEVNGELKKDALRSPGFPYFASLFYRGNNMNSVIAVLRAQTILQCFTFILLSVLCWQSFGAWSSVLMSLLFWTHPAFMSINSYYLTESIFMSSLICLLAIFLISQKNGSQNLPYFILLGVILAISALIRPTMEYYFLFIALIILLRFREKTKQCLPALLTFILIIFTWKIRNYFAIGGGSDPTLMINGLYHGSYPNFMYNNMAESFGFPYRFDPLMKQYYEGVGKTLTLIWQRAIIDPIEYLSWYIMGKQFFLWQWNIVQGQGDVFIYPVTVSPIIYQQDLRFWHSVHYFLNAPMMFIGVLYSYYVVIKTMVKRSSFDAHFLIASLVVYASLFHVIVAPFPRYGIPFKAFVIIACILFLKSLFSNLKNRFVK